jgi:hypothetical protein
MSDIKSISVIDTAKLIRTSLREAFPAVKFGVRAHRYAFGASIHVSWTDGPSTLQVEAITRRFASTYYDTQADHWRHLWHRLTGVRVSFGANLVQCHRQHSDAWCVEAINAVYAQHRDLLTAHGIAAPTVRDFFEGRLHAIPLTPMPPEPDDDIGNIPFGDEPAGPRYISMLDAVREILGERSDCAAPATSATALTVTLLAEDNPAASLAEAGWARATH